MSSPHFYDPALFRAKQVKASFFLRLISLIDIFEDQVWTGRFFYLQHLSFLIPIYNFSREGLFTQFTLEFGEVVCRHHSIHFFLHFAVDPHFQTVHMDNLTRTLAFTRGNQAVVICYFIAKTKFARPLHFLPYFVNSFELLQKTFLFFSLHLCSPISTILNSTLPNLIMFPFSTIIIDVLIG